jgi:hypothetical protein
LALIEGDPGHSGQKSLPFGQVPKFGSLRIFGNKMPSSLELLCGDARCESTQGSRILDGSGMPLWIDLSVYAGPALKASAGWRHDDHHRLEAIHILKQHGDMLRIPEVEAASQVEVNA